MHRQVCIERETDLGIREQEHARSSLAGFSRLVEHGSFSMRRILEVPVHLPSANPVYHSCAQGRVHRFSFSGPTIPNLWKTRQPLGTQEPYAAPSAGQDQIDAAGAFLR